MFERVNWQDLAVGLSLAVLIALIVVQLASRILWPALTMVSGATSDVSFRDPIKRRPIRIVRGSEIPFSHSLYFGEVSKPFLTHTLSSANMGKLAQAAAEATAWPLTSSGSGTDASHSGDDDIG